MALSNTAIPRYYGQFRSAVMRGEVPICNEISMEIPEFITMTEPSRVGSSFAKAR